MTTQHTPGPWMVSEVKDKSNGQLNIYVSTDYTEALRNVQRSLFKCTGSAYMKPGESYKPEMVNTNRANAKLIAAAPDLLEALRKANTCRASMNNDVVLFIDAAFAKVTGKENCI